VLEGKVSGQTSSLSTIIPETCIASSLSDPLVEVTKRHSATACTSVILAFVPKPHGASENRGVLPPVDGINTLAMILIAMRFPIRCRHSLLQSASPAVVMILSWQTKRH